MPSLVRLPVPRDIAPRGSIPRIKQRSKAGLTMPHRRGKVLNSFEVGTVGGNPRGTIRYPHRAAWNRPASLVDDRIDLDHPETRSKEGSSDEIALLLVLNVASTPH